MRIHYLSCHEVLEYDEVKLLTELGHDVFSNGAYLDPKGHITLKRPGIDKAISWTNLAPIAANAPKTSLPKELIEPFDAFIIMHTPEWVTGNWEAFKGKRVIWRSIGQSTPSIEKKLAKARSEGLEIVRYSPKEANIPNYIGGDAMIRFYKDPGQYCGWVGDTDEVVNFTQTLKARGQFVHYDEIMGAMAGFNSKVYGSGNDDLGRWNGGVVSYEKMLQILKHARVFVYAGTWPASYTLSFIEALMTGIPMVVAGKRITQPPHLEQLEFYEADEIIENGVNGFVANTVQEMREAIDKLTKDYELAKTIGAAGRKTALELFARDKIANEWQSYLSGGPK